MSSILFRERNCRKFSLSNIRPIENHRQTFFFPFSGQKVTSRKQSNVMRRIERNEENQLIKASLADTWPGHVPFVLPIRQPIHSRSLYSRVNNNDQSMQTSSPTWGRGTVGTTSVRLPCVEHVLVRLRRVEGIRVHTGEDAWTDATRQLSSIHP